MDGDFTVLNTGWPRLAPDGRFQFCVDPDVREGWRSSKGNRQNTIALIRDAHLMVASGYDAKGIPYPPFIRRFRLAPGGSNKGDSGRNLLLAAQHDKIPIHDIQADRGYTITNADKFAKPLNRTGINVWLDLLPNQRGYKDSYKNVLLVDGGLFSSSLPKSQWNLPACPDNASHAVRDTHEAAFNKRAQTYGFASHGKPRPDGSRRWQGPALAGRLRCINHPQSLKNNPTKVPTSTCKPDDGCSCGQTVTIPADFGIKTRQDAFYGTTEWRKNYNRRSLVEAANSWLKFHRNLDRNSIRVLRDPRTTLHFTLFIVGNLIHATREWHTAMNQTDPLAWTEDNAHDSTPCCEHSPAASTNIGNLGNRPTPDGAPPG